MRRSSLIPVISRDDRDGVSADGRPRAGQYAGCVNQVTGWLRRHRLLVDGALAATLLVPVSGAVASPWLHSSRLVVPAWSAAVSLLLAGLVVVRRRYPAGAFAIAITTGAVALGTDLRTPPKMNEWAAFNGLVLLYTLAAYCPRRISVRGLYLCLAFTTAVAIRVTPGPASSHIGVIILVALASGVPTVGVWVLGDSVGYRRAHYAWLEERARRAEAERDAKARLAAAAERSRIAREMHDIIAHNLSVIVGLADGGRYAAARSPERSAQALGAIADVGRESLSELRQLLGVLTENGHPAAELAPQPGLTDLEALLGRVRAAGLPVRCTVHGDPGGLSEGRQLAVYRIVQEALTNTLKHAGPAAAAEIVLGYAGGAVDVQVTDTGRGTTAGAPDGQGLHGMRERAAMYEGTLRAGAVPSGGWRVEAHLPAPQATAAPS
jgi:signal transduction histidine kinase